LADNTLEIIAWHIDGTGLRAVPRPSRPNPVLLPAATRNCSDRYRRRRDDCERPQYVVRDAETRQDVTRQLGRYLGQF
jgi:hypothetical protein